MSEKLYEVDLQGGLARLGKHNELLSRLTKHIGAPTYMVGGPVRDALLGRESKDLDVVTIGNQEHMDKFVQSGAKRIKGDFPVFSHPDYPGVEVAFGRKERKTGEGHKSFDWELAPDLNTDLERRDFTINAMAYHPEKGIVDPLGGMEHLKQGVLSATTSAFKDDPLRILRGARFASQLGMEPDEKTRSLMRSGASELHTEPKERVRGEFEKSLKSPHPDKFFRTLAGSNAIDQWFPEIGKLQNAPAGPEKYHPEGSAFEHTMLALRAAADMGHSPASRLFTLVHDTGKAETPKEQWPKQTGHEDITEPASNLVKRLDMGKGIEKDVATHVLNHMLPHGSQRPGMVGHRPGTVTDYFGRVKRIFEPHMQSVEADASGKGTGPIAHPYADNYRKLFDVYKTAGNEPDLSVEQRRMARAQALSTAMRKEVAEAIEEAESWDERQARLASARKARKEQRRNDQWERQRISGYKPFRTPTIDWSVLKRPNQDALPGGKGDDKTDADFEPKEIEMGKKVEAEHTNNPAVADEIAHDHLSEDPHYYEKLKKAGLADELESADNYAKLVEEITKDIIG